jgi:hypothetical protein
MGHIVTTVGVEMKCANWAIPPLRHGFRHLEACRFGPGSGIEQAMAAGYPPTAVSGPSGRAATEA